MVGAVGFSKMYAKSLPLKEFEDTKGVMRIRNSKKNRQRNGQKKKLEKPTAPTIFYVVCRTTSAVALWRSEFNGGSEQEFYVQYWRISQPLPSMLSPSIPDDRLTFTMRGFKIQ
jgi:hypothetical protein